MPALIKITIKNHIGILALDHYKKRNALSQAMIDEILIALDDMKEEGVRVVILRQEGVNPVWSAGHDVDELPVANKDPLPYDDPLMKLLRAIRRFPTPVIAMIHGSVWGGALDVVMNCDLVYGDETCAFAITPAKLGLPYNASGIQHFLARLPIHVVKELFFTAEPISAERALRFGLVNDLVPQEQLEQFTLNIAATICSRSSESIAAFKEQARLMIESCLLNPEQFEYIDQIRRNVYQGKDYNEGIKGFLEKRPPRF